MNKTFRRIVTLLLAAAMILAVMTACGKKPCVNCGEPASKEFKSSGSESSYYCDDCASDCMFCGDEASWVSESAFGSIFVCNDCRGEINDFLN